MSREPTAARGVLAHSVHPEQSTVRVAVVDRRRLVREGLADALRGRADLMVVATAAGPAELPTDSNVEVVLVHVDDVVPDGWAGRVIRFDGNEKVTDLAAAVHAGQQRPLNSRHPAPRPRLTTRETDVMREVAEGKTTAEIAVALGIASKSVDNLKQRIYTKLGVQSQAHAVSVLLRASLLPVGRHARGAAG